jgi:hypothetical protein
MISRTAIVIGLASLLGLTGYIGVNAADQDIVASTRVSQPNGARSFKTVYVDGRISQVRNFDYFDFYRDKAPSAASQPINLIIVTVEWGRYDAVVGDRTAAFAQLPSNIMAGGDVETNNRVGRPSRSFFATARKAFAQQRNNLTRIDQTVPNRNIDMVSFDFVTNKGTFTIQQDLRSLENGTSPWSNMFREARALREKVRLAAPGR